jgi:Fe-S cluster assembly iron-binding protein IscA
MALTVTEQATAALKELLEVQDHESEQVLRLLAEREGIHGLQLDVPREEDQIVEYDGEAVMVLDPALSDDLTGNVLDLKETPSGASLTMYRSPH